MRPISRQEYLNLSPKEQQNYYPKMYEGVEWYHPKQIGENGEAASPVPSFESFLKDVLGLRPKTPSFTDSLKDELKKNVEANEVGSFFSGFLLDKSPEVKDSVGGAINTILQLYRTLHSKISRLLVITFKLETENNELRNRIQAYKNDLRQLTNMLAEKENSNKTLAAHLEKLTAENREMKAEIDKNSVNKSKKSKSRK